MQGAILVAPGLPWVASNTDMTIPTATGVGPGNGTLVAPGRGVRRPRAAGRRQADVAAVRGDHHPRRWRADPLVVGDRLDTDIEGAVTMGWDSLLVLTGVTGLEELVRAAQGGATDVRRAGPRRPRRAPAGARAARRRRHARRLDRHRGRTVGCSVDGRRIVPRDWWRVVAVAAWRHLDETGQPVETDGVQPSRVACRP